MDRNKQRQVLVIGTGTPLERAYAVLRSRKPSQVVAALDVGEDGGQPQKVDLRRMGDYASDEWLMFVALSNERLNGSRRGLMDVVKTLGYQFDRCISPLAAVPEDWQPGRNTFIGDFVVVGSKASIGDNCWIDSRAIIGYGVTIADSVWIGAGALLGDHVKVGENTNVANGAVLPDNVVVGRRCELLSAREYRDPVPDNTFIHPLFGSVRIYGSPTMRP